MTSQHPSTSSSSLNPATAYKAFLLRNAARVSQVESSLRTLTWLLPGRFSDSDLASESLYSLLNLLSLYHDSVLLSLFPSPSTTPYYHNESRTSSRSGVSPALGEQSPSLLEDHKPSSHTRYTRFWSTPTSSASSESYPKPRGSKTYRLLSRTLVIISYLELVAEMGVGKFGIPSLGDLKTGKIAMRGKRRVGDKGKERMRWKFVMGLEVIKTIIRLILLRSTHSRTLINPPVPEREIDPAALPLSHETDPSKPEDGESTGGYEVIGNGGIASENGHLNGNGNMEGMNRNGEEGKLNWKGKRTGLSRPTIASIRYPNGDVPTLNGDADASFSQMNGLPNGHPPNGLLDGSGPSTPRSTLTIREAKKQVDDYLSKKVLTIDDVRNPWELVRRLDGDGLLGEMLWILRPVFYVYLLKKYGKSHPVPFIFSFSLEYISYTLRTSYFKSRSSPPPEPCSPFDPFSLSEGPLSQTAKGEKKRKRSVFEWLGGTSGDNGDGDEDISPLSEVEKRELKKRERAFWWYLVRGPVWEGWTKPSLSAISNSLREKPLLGLASSYLDAYLPMMDSYYYYTST